jgi:hypothetical protein
MRSQQQQQPPPPHHHQQQQPPHLLLLPTAGEQQQLLQAEAALDEISREVMRLRAQQRGAMRQRRADMKVAMMAMIIVYIIKR